jgi:glycosyltransferase involved in cell wall biosynthesis
MKRWLTNIHHGSKLKRFFYNPYHIPFLLRSTNVLRQVIRQYRVNLVHTATSVVLDGAIAAALEEIPHVWHIRETIEPGKVWSFFLGAKVARRLINYFSNRIIVISEAIGKVYLTMPDNVGKIRIVHNAVDTALYDNKLDIPVLRQKLGIPLNAKLVGIVAQVVPLKRHEDFLRAAAIVRQSIPDSFFLSVGDNGNTSEYGQTVKKLLQELGLTERTVWLGFSDRIHEIYGAIDLLVLPSDEESFGRVAIEAMAARKPVVATTVGGIPEIVVDGETGYLVPPRSPDALAQAIIHLLNNPDLAQAMGQAGRRRVEQHFSLARYVDGVEAVYKELLSR